MLDALTTYRTEEALRNFKRCQDKITLIALNGIEETPYLILFSQLDSKDWERVLKEMSKCFTFIHETVPLISQYNYMIDRMDRRVRRIPFNTPNPNMQLSRLEAVDCILHLTGIRDKLQACSGFAIDFMQKLKTVLESLSPEGDTVHAEIGEVFRRSSRLTATFENWMDKDIFSENYDYHELIEESRDNALKYNYLRT